MSMNMNESVFPNQLRIDARDKVRGAALYAADQALPGMLHAALAVSTTNRGEVRSIDSRAAREVGGVRLVYRMFSHPYLHPRQRGSLRIPGGSFLPAR